MDEKNIGLKIGLEIHQQLETGKLFCGCPSFLRNDNPEVIIRRRLHQVAGESGEVDIAVKHEITKEKEFTYEGYYNNCCLVDYDESPPREINQEALKTAVQIALLLNCKIVQLTQIMRKTVVDGSNTSGFQRSVLIARDGFVETGQGKVGIQYVYLEEDAARKVSDEEGKIIYRLDRLGIPLVEIVTAPDIKTPEQAREVALHIGEILRACKVRRGIGTIRQDINVSIKGHPRAEIKGFQDPKIFVKVVEKEVERQLKDLEAKRKDLVPEVRGANPDGTTKYLRPLPGVARMYPETDLPLLKISLEMINEAKRTLPKMKKDMEKELEGRGLSNEMIKLLLKYNKINEFKEMLHIINNPNLIAKVLLIFPKEISSHEKISLKEVEKILNRDALGNVLENLKKGKISESDVKNILEKIVKGESHKEAIGAKKENIHLIDEKIMKIIKEKPRLSMNAYMGLVMNEFKGKISGKEASEIIRKHMK